MSDRPGDDEPSGAGDPARVRPARVRPVDLRDYADFDPDRPRRIRVHATDVLTIDLWCLEPGQGTGLLQYADVDVAYTVLGGNAWVVTDEGELGLGPLGSILVPGEVAHGIDNRAADPLVVLAAGSPPDVAAADVAADQPVTRTDAAIHREGERRGVTSRLRDAFRP